MDQKLITITSTVLKKGVPDSRQFSASVISRNSSAFFVLSHDCTHRALTRMRFSLSPDCLISFDGHTYKVINVNYSSSPKIPIIEAALIS